jgi:hypothetical protein
MTLDQTWREQEIYAAYKFDCPYCDHPARGLITIKKDDKVGLRVTDPKMIIDEHLHDSPNCELQLWDTNLHPDL